NANENDSHSGAYGGNGGGGRGGHPTHSASIFDFGSPSLQNAAGARGRAGSYLPLTLPSIGPCGSILRVPAAFTPPQPLGSSPRWPPQRPGSPASHSGTPCTAWQALRSFWGPPRPLPEGTGRGGPAGGGWRTPA